MVDLLDIENIVFARTQYYGKKKYPDAFFTTSDKNESNPIFPTIKIKYLGGVETGKDYNGTDINAIIAPFQIEVYTNKSASEANKIITEIMQIMKSMRFEIIKLPYTDNQDGVYCKIARAQRLIGSGDIL